MTEKQVLNKIMTKLSGLKFSGSVIWYSRLQSGRLGTVTLNPAGTPDICVITNNYDGTISLVFLEVKKSSHSCKTKDIRFEQREFFNSMEGKPRTLCAVINNPEQLNTIIKKAKNL